MAKYLKLFFVALFATLALSLASCGGDDDEDEPSANVAKGELSIDGTKYVFDVFMSSANDDFSCLLYTKKGNDYSLLISISEWNDVYKDFTWDSSNYDDVDSYLTVTWTSGEAKIGHGPVSGTVKVTSIDKKSNKVTLSFNKAEFEYYDGDYYNLPSFTVDGTITMPINS